jgi:hypothetical protein
LKAGRATDLGSFAGHQRLWRTARGRQVIPQELPLATLLYRREVMPGQPDIECFYASFWIAAVYALLEDAREARVRLEYAY